MNRAKSLLLIGVSAVLLPWSPARAEPPQLGFREAGEGMFEFDTGLLRGRLKLDGTYQGLYPLVHGPSGAELVHAPGVFSFYRVLATNRRHGKNARDWPTQSELLADGAVEVRFAPADEHPLEIVGVHRFAAPGTLDLEIEVAPRCDMPRFELFLSSYFGPGFLASVWVDDSGGGRFVPIDRPPDAQGAYVMYPRDDEAVAMIRDGRWQYPPNPVDWAVGRRLRAPLVIRRDTALGLSAVMMCPPGDCFAVASPWNPASPDAKGYRSVYLSLFGRDLRAGEKAHARCRLLLAEDLSDEQAVELYRDYLAQRKQSP